MATVIEVKTTPIRKVNVRKDLMGVADLIELCFATTLDADGRDYLRHLRGTARDLSHLPWVQGAAERLASPLYGYVWEEDGRIIGNLSLIPLNRRGRLVYLIANVAVHPDYRRRGIARQLTQTALDHLKARGIENAWLQVRDDNPGAYHLYRSLGFVERARRTTWQIDRLAPLDRPIPQGIQIQRRGLQDWDLQAAWLNEIYPPEIAWNLPISFSRLSPDILGFFLRWMRGEALEHWSAREQDAPVGFASWEPMRASSDIIWLATTPQYEDLAVLALLIHARAVLAGRGRPLSVNYPAGRAELAFQRAGFSNRQTLVWMVASLNRG
jgi:GNAT superfamily N-acetyltransferase